MSSSTNRNELRNIGGQPHDWRPTVSQSVSAIVNRFRPLTTEEQETHRKWRRITLVFYGLLAAFIGVSITIGPPAPTTAKHNPAPSAMASTR